MNQPVNVVIQGDCLEVLKTFADGSVDSVVTDPPAGIEFMGSEWDTFRQGRLKAYSKPMAPADNVREGEQGFRERMSANPSFQQKANARCAACQRYRFSGTPCECEVPDWELDTSTRDTFIAFMREVMAECLRVLKPGGHALVWAIPRTSHWTATAIEDAGFEIRDSIMHIFGQGFPKSHNVSKAIDKAKGAKRKVVKEGRGFDPEKNKSGQFDAIRPSNVGVNTPAFNARIGEVTEPATPEAQEWDGWGTQLKPAVEVWWLCRKPLQAKNVMSQVLETGTGAINIDGTRIGKSKRVPGGLSRTPGTSLSGSVDGSLRRETGEEGGHNPNVGRWPANLVLSHGPGCRQIGTRQVDAPTINRFTDGMKPFGEGAGHPYETSGGGTEELAVYECQPGCPVAGLDEQGKKMGSHSAGCATSPKFERSENTNTYGKASEGLAGARHGDDGGVSRFFQTFEPGYECEPGCPVAALDEQSGELKSGALDLSSISAENKIYGARPKNQTGEYEANSGGASRFFQTFEPDYDVPFIYTGKASKKDKNADLEVQSLLPALLEPKPKLKEAELEQIRDELAREGVEPWFAGTRQYLAERVPKDLRRFFQAVRTWDANSHPTVKSQALMTYLVRLVTPKGGVVLDPFAGSGSTLVAAVTEGFKFIGIEREPDFHRIATKRTEKARARVETENQQRAAFEAMAELPED